MVYLALSYDHRIVDGADAARFLTTMKTRLEAGAFERALGLADRRPRAGIRSAAASEAAVKVVLAGASGFLGRRWSRT